METYCVYDSHDKDGLFSGIIMYKEFGDEATYIPVKPSFNLDEIVYSDDNEKENGIFLEENCRIFFADVCPSKAEMRILNGYNSVETTVIDHHKDAKEAIELADNSSFSEDKSACVLAWEYFEKLNFSNPPKVLQYVQDQDLWNWELDGSEQVNLALDQMIGSSTEVHDLFRLGIYLEYSKGVRDNVLELKERGRYLKIYRDGLIEECLDNVQEIQFEGYKTGAVNSSLFRSKIGERLYEGEYDVGMIWKIDSEGNVKVSLRTNVDKIDLSEICSNYGGGGHSDAAGFSTSKEKFDELTGLLS